MYRPPPSASLLSCQARDLKVLLGAGYQLSQVQPFDLFPHTRHLESVATLDWCGEGVPPSELEG